MNTKKKARRGRFGINAKVSLGFLILAGMLLISGALSIHELTRMGQEVRQLLDDSYRSVQYSQAMLVALESEQNAILHQLAGPYSYQAQICPVYQRAEADFLRNLSLARANLTHRDEDVVVDSITSSYARLSVENHRFLKRPDASLRLYVDSIQPLMHRVSRGANRLLTMNQHALYDSSSLLEHSAQRALRPGLIIILVSILFTLMFTYLIRRFYVQPIRRMVSSIHSFIHYNHYAPVPMVANDELLELRDAIDQLVVARRNTTSPNPPRA